MERIRLEPIPVKWLFFSDLTNTSISLVQESATFFRQNPKEHWLLYEDSQYSFYIGIQGFVSQSYPNVHLPISLNSGIVPHLFVK